jgi:uncharacterized protein YndB with AHSA1/START domain
MITTKTENMLEMRRTFKVSPERMFQIWTEPEHMVNWFGCQKATKVEVEQDFRVGGEYRVAVLLTDGEEVIMTGTFLEIAASSKLVYSWSNTSVEFPASDTLVCVEFIERPTGTEVVLTHSKFSKPVSVQGHSMGWGNCFENIAALLAD